MSFDPQNPRGAPRPAEPPPSAPSHPKPGNYIPPQPVNSDSRRSRPILIVGIIVIVVLALLALYMSLPRTGESSPPPSTAHPSQVAPTVAGSHSSTSVPSALVPTAALFTPVASPPAGYDGFVLHIPDQIRATCIPATSPDPDIEFSTFCTTTEGIKVAYAQYVSATSMDTAYQAAFTAQLIDADTGSCEDHSTWPAESAYQVEGQPAGRRLCADIQGSPTIFWTDERLTIYSSATGSDPTQLVEFWTNEAGPVQ